MKRCVLCPDGHPDGLRHSNAEIRAHALGWQQGKAEARATAGAVEPPPTYTEVERLDRPGNRANLTGGAAGAVEGADPLLDTIAATGFIERESWPDGPITGIHVDYADDIPRFLEAVRGRATTPEAPASPPPLDVERLAAACARVGLNLSGIPIRAIARQYAALASAAPSEPGEP